MIIIHEFVFLSDSDPNSRYEWYMAGYMIDKDYFDACLPPGMYGDHKGYLIL